MMQIISTMVNIYGKTNAHLGILSKSCIPLKHFCQQKISTIFFLLCIRMRKSVHDYWQTDKLESALLQSSRKPSQWQLLFMLVRLQRIKLGHFENKLKIVGCIVFSCKRREAIHFVFLKCTENVECQNSSEIKKNIYTSRISLEALINRK